MGAVVENGRKERNPRVSTGFNLGMENELADAGRDGRTCDARPNSQARTEIMNCSFSLFS